MGMWRTGVPFVQAFIAVVKDLRGRHLQGQC